MIPRIAKGGRSFKGAYQYFGHDKEKSSKHRVAWTHTENMITDDPEKAWKVMAYTAKVQDRLKEASGQKATGRKLQKPVFSYSLAWHPEQKPDRAHMLATAKKSLIALGLEDHEVFMIAHKDEPHKHVHVIVNRVHPLTGLAASLSNSRRKLSDFARTYEKENGKVYCLQREKNFQKRKEGVRTRYGDPNIVAAWQETNDGKGFASALQKRGYHLAQGYKRIVVIDPHGKIHNPARHLDGLRAKDIRQKLGDFNFASLPDAAKLSEQIQQKHRQVYQESEQKRIVVSAQKQNQLQDRQIEERAKLSDEHYRRIEGEREGLTEYYKIKDRQKEIAQLAEKLNHPTPWQKISGQFKAGQTELAGSRKNLALVQARIKEKMDFLEGERDRGMTALTERHAKEKALLLERGPETLPKPALHHEMRDREKKRDRDFER
jgi:Relaxase/Mobilisation nuclease domain